MRHGMRGWCGGHYLRHGRLGDCVGGTRGAGTGACHMTSPDETLVILVNLIDRWDRDERIRRSDAHPTHGACSSPTRRQESWSCAHHADHASVASDRINATRTRYTYTEHGRQPTLEALARMATGVAQMASGRRHGSGLLSSQDKLERIRRVNQLKAQKEGMRRWARSADGMRWGRK